MLQRRTFVLFLLALAFGSLAALIAYQRVQKPVATGPDSQPVLVAAFDIEYGAKIEAEMVKLVAWPVASVPEGALTSPADAIGKVANQTIGRGEPVTSRRAVESLGGSSLASLIAPNMRALTVRVNDVIGVAGFLLPGNRVDVLSTPAQRGPDQRPKTRTLLQNIKVLAVDQQARTAKDDPIVVRAVTVEVDPRQAEIIVQATEEGTVQLVLRNPLDQQVEDEPKPAPAAAPVQRRPARPAPVVVAPPPPPPEKEAVTIIRGTKSEDSDVKP